MGIRISNQEKLIEWVYENCSVSVDDNGELVISQNGEQLAFNEIARQADLTALEEKVTPIQEVDEAVTFEESEVSVAHDSTRVANESIELESSDSFTSDAAGSATSHNYDITVEKNDAYLSQLGLLVYDSGTYTVELFLNGNSVISKDKSLTDQEYQKFEFSESEWGVLPQSGDTVTVDITGPDYIDGDGTQSYSGDLFSISSETMNGTSDGATVVFTGTPTSGSATISWPSPDALKAWDLATYQANEAGETVTIDILDESDNVLHEDVRQNFDISSIDADNIALRANLSRNDTTNNPTLDYAARRYNK